MSLLNSTVYANPTTSVWAPAGSGSGTGPTGPTGPAAGPTGPTGVQGPTGPVGVNPGGEAYNVNWLWTNGTSPSNSPLELTANAVPSPDYTFIQARRYDSNGSSATFYGRYGSGECVLEYALDGQFYLPLTIRSRPLTVLGDTTSVMRLTDELTGGTGVFTVDASNNLYWNGTKLN